MAFNRIISLVPSLTELIFELGLENKLVGRTRFCIHPEEKVTEIPIIGGTKNPNVEKILSFNPDYIIANHEENRKEDIELLQNKTHVNVTEIDTIEDALRIISELGRDFDAEKKARDLISRIKSLLENTIELAPVKTAYFIWKKPWMVAASGTYIDSVLEHYNLENVFSDQERYPEISLSELAKKSPELILLSSEPYPFKQKHIQEIQKLCPESDIQLINGEWFSWYGSGMVDAFKELNDWRNNISKSSAL